MAKLTMPDGFIAHGGGECPLEPETLVETIIRTADGFGSAGVTRAHLHEWREDRHPNGIGAVVGYRLADGPDPVFDPVNERHRSPRHLKPHHRI